MDNRDLLSYKLRQTINQDKGYAILSLGYWQYSHEFKLGQFELDKDDIEYLVNKYSISELKEKEIESELTLKKFNEIQEQIKVTI